MILQTILGLLLSASAAITLDWITFGRLGAFYIDREASYSFKPKRQAVAVLTGTYLYWAVGTHQPPNELPAVFLMPFVLGAIVWGVLLLGDVKRSLRDEQVDRYGP